MLFYLLYKYAILFIPTYTNMFIYVCVCIMSAPVYTHTYTHFYLYQLIYIYYFIYIYLCMCTILFIPTFIYILFYFYLLFSRNCFGAGDTTANKTGKNCCYSGAHFPVIVSCWNVLPLSSFVFVVRSLFTPTYLLLKKQLY